MTEGEGRPQAVSRRGGAQLIPRPPGTRPGRSAPWSGLEGDDRRVDVARIRRAVAAQPGGPPPPEPLGTPTSAVLVPVFDDDNDDDSDDGGGGGEAVVVLTRRAAHLRRHRGEVSFPGGAREPDESLERTALRESEEEIGLDPSAVEVVGELDHLTTMVSHRAIVPFVGLLAGRPELVANPGEVERILLVPVAELLSDQVFREERWPWPVPPGTDTPGGDGSRPMWFYELDGDTVWGATARVLTLFLARVLGVEVPPG